MRSQQSSTLGALRSPRNASPDVLETVPAKPGIRPNKVSQHVRFYVLWIGRELTESTPPIRNPSIHQEKNFFFTPPLPLFKTCQFFFQGIWEKGLNFFLVANSAGNFFFSPFKRPHQRLLFFKKFYPPSFN